MKKLSTREVNNLSSQVVGWYWFLGLSHRRLKASSVFSGLCFSSLHLLSITLYLGPSGHSVCLSWAKILTSSVLKGSAAHSLYSSLSFMSVSPLSMDIMTWERLETLLHAEVNPLSYTSISKILLLQCFRTALKKPCMGQVTLDWNRTFLCKEGQMYQSFLFPCCSEKKMGPDQPYDLTWSCKCPYISVFLPSCKTGKRRCCGLALYGSDQMALQGKVVASSFPLDRRPSEDRCWVLFVFVCSALEQCLVHSRHWDICYMNERFNKNRARRILAQALSP